jgi:hypothetical protein
MPSHFYIKQNDTRPALVANLTDADGGAVSLTGATVKFYMRVEPAGATKIGDGSATVLDADAGQVSYAWIAADTDTADDFEGEFEVTFAGGKVQTYPGRNWILIHIVDDIA